MKDPSSVIGRGAELAALNGFLRAEGHSAGALVLEGEAGIGKTTLWRAGIEMACSSYRVLVARAAASEVESPFATLAELLDERAAGVLPNLPLPQRRALEVALLLTEPGEAAPQPHAIASGFLSAVRLLAAEGALLLALDDVQWID